MSSQITRIFYAYEWLVGPHLILAFAGNGRHRLPPAPTSCPILYAISGPMLIFIFYYFAKTGFRNSLMHFYTTSANKRATTNGKRRPQPLDACKSISLAFVSPTLNNLNTPIHLLCLSVFIHSFIPF